MKYFLSLALVFSSSILGYGQTKFNPIITLSYMNVIYTTIDNMIEVHVNVPLSDIECSIDKNGVVEEGRFNTYNVRVKEEGYYQFEVKQKSTGISVTHSLRAKKLPIPLANLKGHFGDSITTNQITEAKQLDLSYVPAFDINISAEVNSFTLLKISKNNNRTEVDNFSATFSRETKTILDSSENGDILIFKNIEGRGVDPGVIKMSDLILYVK